MWNELYQRLTTDDSLSVDEVNIIVNASPRAESVLGFRFPTSYRQYSLVFGPGRLARYFEIAVPGEAAWGPMQEIIEMNEASNKFAPQSYLEEIHHSHIELIRRLIYFAETGDGDTIGWDPEEMTDRMGQEYRIYFVPRIGPPVSLIGSFTEFVTDICLGSKLPTVLPFDASEWGGDFRQNFTRFCP